MVQSRPKRQEGWGGVGAEVGGSGKKQAGRLERWSVTARQGVRSGHVLEKKPGRSRSGCPHPHSPVLIGSFSERQHQAFWGEWAWGHLVGPG